MNQVTYPRARIVADIRYPSGGYFNMVPQIQRDSIDFSVVSEKTGYYWYVISESGKFDSGFNKKSQEVWFLDKTATTTSTGLSATDFGYSDESLSPLSGYSRRPFSPNLTSITGVTNWYCRSMENLVTSGDSGYEIDRRKALRLNCYDFNGISGNTQWILNGLTGEIFTGAPATGYVIPDDVFDYSPIIGSRGNVVTRTSGIYGFSGTLSSVSFEYQRRKIDATCSGRFYVDNTGSLARLGSYFSYPTGTQQIILQNESTGFSWITGYYIEGNFTTRLDVAQNYSYVTKRPSSLIWANKYPEAFNNQSGNYFFDTGNFASPPIASGTVAQIPYVTLTLNDLYSGFTQTDIYKNGVYYQKFLTSDVFTGATRTGWHDLNELQSGSPNEYKGILPSGSPQELPENDLTLGHKGQILYRDYNIVPGIQYSYDSKVDTSFADSTSGVSPYSFTDNLSYPKKDQSGYFYFSEMTGSFALVNQHLVLDSSVNGFTGTIVAHSNSQLPFDSVEIGGQGFATNPLVSRIQDLVNFTYGHQFQTGWSHLKFTFPADTRYNEKSSFVNIFWYDSTSSVPDPDDNNDSPNGGSDGS
jgi:hypothetical protein